MVRAAFVTILILVALAGVCGGCGEDLYKGRFICDNGQTVVLELHGDPSTIEKLSGVLVKSPFAGDETTRISCLLELDEHQEKTSVPFPLSGEARDAEGRTR